MSNIIVGMSAASGILVWSARGLNMSGLKDALMSVIIVGETLEKCTDDWQNSPVKNLEKIKKITATSFLAIMTGITTHYFVEIICTQLSNITDLVRALVIGGAGRACIICRPKWLPSSVSWVLEVGGKVCFFTGGSMALVYGINCGANALAWIKG